jgi:hypothetical protein
MNLVAASHKEAITQDMNKVIAAQMPTDNLVMMSYLYALVIPPYRVHLMF